MPGFLLGNPWSVPDLPRLKGGPTLLVTGPLQAGPVDELDITLGCGRDVGQ